MRRASGWKRLWRHSYRVGLRWLVRESVHGWPAKRTALARLFVPLDPWRYYEMGKAADLPFEGRCLDVSSPKLLTSLLQREGRGRWTGVDLFDAEIAAWRHLDRDLDLAVEDATALSFPDETFDNVACISVLEHVGRGKDSLAMAEFWRVLKPGGGLVLTTDVAAAGRDVYLGEEIYGQASERVDDERVFFKHDYGVAEIDGLLGERDWIVDTREYAVQRDPGIERRFYDRAPWSYVYGPLLRFRCPGNFATSPDPDLIGEGEQGVVFLVLKKPV